MNTLLTIINTFYRDNTILSIYFILLLLFLLMEILFLLKIKWIIFKLEKKLARKNFKKGNLLANLIKDYKKSLKINFYKTDSILFIKDYLENNKKRLFRGLNYIENSPALYILMGLLAIIFITASSILGTEFNGLTSLQNVFNNLDIISVTIVFSLTCSIIIKIFCYALNIRDDINRLCENIQEYLEGEIRPQSYRKEGQSQVIYEFKDMMEKKLSDIEKRISSGFSEIILRMNSEKYNEKNLKIFHTADIHIGLKFENYPPDIAEKLAEARFKVLERLINTACVEDCNIFAVCGDLFESTDINEKDLFKVINILNGFSGGVVLLLPGNHDYYNSTISLWEKIKENTADNILVLNEYKPYELNEFGLKVTVFPAYCDSEEDKNNRLGWINSNEKEDGNLWHIGLAHGSLQDKFPDMKYNYYMMSEEELKNIAMDIWLIGHTHDPYPEPGIISNNKIFNAGTPEIDSEKRMYDGNAWLININRKKQITALGLKTGKYRHLIMDGKNEDE